MAELAEFLKQMKEERHVFMDEIGEYLEDKREEEIFHLKQFRNAVNGLESTIMMLTEKVDDRSFQGKTRALTELLEKDFKKAKAYAAAKNAR